MKASFVVILSVVLLSVVNGYAKNKKDTVTILEPARGSEISSQVPVRGTATLSEGNHLWVLARRSNFKPLWWPQNEAEVDPKTGEWSSAASCGGPQDVGWNFDIGAVIVDKKGHELLKDYWMKATQSGDWKPIDIPSPVSPPQIITVKKVKH